MSFANEAWVQGLRMSDYFKANTQDWPNWATSFLLAS